MKTCELLDELRRSILRDISTAVNPSPDGQLWTDASLMRYINEGYSRFARKTHALRDNSTPAVTQIVLRAGVAEYDLDSRVVEVYSAEAAGFEIVVSTHPSVRRWPAAVALQTARNAIVPPGRPVLFQVDEATRRIRFVPTPSAEFDGVIAQLGVARLPLVRLSKAQPDAEPEIDEDYHLDILEWAAWRALRNHDVDAENMGKASAHKTQFNAAVDEYKKHVKRLNRRPVQFVRNGADYGGNCR